jgi:predicted RecB family nuclease
MIRDVAICERRVRHDLHGDPAGRDPVSAFVQLLWEGGRQHEKEVLSTIGDGVVDLRDLRCPDHRFVATVDALESDARIILGARLEVDDRLGLPDIIERIDGEWVAGDVKSGCALDADGKRPRLEYAVQVAHYAELLADLGHGSPDAGFVIGRDGKRTKYDLSARWRRDGASLTDITSMLADQARGIRDENSESRGALSAICKLCHWQTVCKAELTEAGDATLIAGVGRSVRDALLPIAPSVRALADLAIPAAATAKSLVAGVGIERLRRFQDRARLLLIPGAQPYARRPLGLTRVARELHFDIEADPSRDNLIYLHGILDRRLGSDGQTEEYVQFFADGPDGERDAFAAAMNFLTADQSAMIYYYSKYERTSYRLLQARYPDVCSPEDIERLFNPKRAIDLLFDVIMPWTEWPTSNVSIKTLARYVGFDWRDTDASGASSIVWFDDYVKSGDPAIRERIVIYNCDDVRASAAVLDGLIALPVLPPPDWPHTGSEL